MSWFDPTVECEVVWTGGMTLRPSGVSWPSSLLAAGDSQQPDKSTRTSGTRVPVRRA